MLPTAFLSLGVGCAVSWYLLSGSWPSAFLPVPLSGIPVGISSSFTCAAIALTLAGLAALRSRLDPTLLRRVVFVSGLVVSLIFVGIATGMAGGFAGGVWPRALWSVALGVGYGLALCAWAQNLSDRTPRGALISTSLGLLVAGCLITASALNPGGLAIGAIALPFLSFLLFGLAWLVRGHAVPAQKKLSRPARRQHPISLEAGYAVLMGFTTTQFFELHEDAMHLATVVCMVVASGMVFLFVALFLIRSLGITWCLLLVGMLFGIVTVFWLVLPRASDLVVVTTATLHWSSMLLLAAAAFDAARAHARGSVAMVCMLLGLFYAASALGSFTVYLGIASRVLVCAGALLLIFMTFLLARHENALSLQPARTQKASGRRDALQALARQCRLTPRETDVFLLIAEGNTVRHIADTLILSENTVKRHRTNLYQKLDVSSRQELIDKARDFTEQEGET